MPKVDTYISLVPKGLLVVSLEIGPDRVFIVARTASEACTCPGCGHASRRVRRRN
jgi:hypothetical protein